MRSFYNPKTFKKDELPKLHQFINKFNFATIITTPSGGLTISHLPLLLDSSRGRFGILQGHCAKANAHWKDFETGTNVVCIFNGPHGYISPSWYVDPLNVPTWNYAVVHISGKAKTITEANALDEILAQTVQKHESEFEKPWLYKLPDEFKSDLHKAIVGFEIEIEAIEGKFKLSQNRSREDWQSAVRHVEHHYSKSNPDLVKMMNETIKDDL